MNQQEFELLQYNAYLQRLIDLVKQNQPEVVDAFFHSIPKPLANEPNIIAEYVRFLLKRGTILPRVICCNVHCVKILTPN